MVLQCLFSYRVHQATHQWHDTCFSYHTYNSTARLLVKVSNLRSRHCNKVSLFPFADVIFIDQDVRFTGPMTSQVLTLEYLIGQGKQYKNDPLNLTMATL